MHPPDDDTVSSLKAALRGAPVMLALLFGSRARGSAHEGSDVDVAFVPVDPGVSLRDEMELAESLSRATRRKVDLVRLDRADVVLRSRIAREGIALVEARPGALARFRADAVLEYLDIEPLLLDARGRYLARIARGAP